MFPRFSSTFTPCHGWISERQVGFAGSLVGLSDDLLGIVDISLEKLPLNTKISGSSAALPAYASIPRRIPRGPWLTRG